MTAVSKAMPAEFVSANSTAGNRLTVSIDHQQGDQALAASIRTDAPLRLLYVGILRDGDNGPDRVDSFARAGFDVLSFDTGDYLHTCTRVEASLAYRYQIGQPVRALNRDLLRSYPSGSFDVLFVDKGMLLKPETVRELRQRATRSVAVHYTPDAQFLSNRSRLFFAGVPHYDLAVTTKRFELEHYRNAGANEVLVILQGYGGRLKPVHRADIPNRFRADAVFVGRAEPHYTRRLKAASKATQEIAVWGPPWPAYAKRHAWARAHVRGPGVWGEDYARALCGGRIGLGLLSKLIPETSTTRSFEIPGTGTFMLAERTAEHEALFEEGLEAEFFADDEEMRDKIHHYLKNDHQRSTIASAGHERCLASDYSIDGQFGRIARWIRGATA